MVRATNPPSEAIPAVRCDARDAPLHLPDNYPRTVVNSTLRGTFLVSYLSYITYNYLQALGTSSWYKQHGWSQPLSRSDGGVC